MNYLKDSKIDPDALDVELLNQSHLAITYGIEWADRTHELALLNEEMKVLVADLTVTVNSAPDTYLGEGVKATVDNVKSYVVRHKKRVALEEQIMEKERDVAIALIAKNEISSGRKSSLENLVRLAGQNYFATPSTPRNLANEAEKREQAKTEANARVAQKMQRRSN